MDTLTPGELVPISDREKQIRAAIEQVFVGGNVPTSIIIYADITGAGSVRVSCVGAVVELRALLLAGTHQCASMIDGAMSAQAESPPTGTQH